MISTKGNIIQLTDIKNNKNYLSTDTIAPLLICIDKFKIIYPVSASFESEILSVTFEKNLKQKLKSNKNQRTSLLNLLTSVLLKILN
ncbi:MAG: hypothetical protein IPF54_27790 [Draconibacterium sp.]|nr:hypothetical protein [Draconibacterium sp.]